MKNNGILSGKLYFTKYLNKNCIENAKSDNIFILLFLGD